MRWQFTVTLLDMLDIACVAAMLFVVASGWRRIRIRVVARTLLAVALAYLGAQALGLRLTVVVFNVSALVAGLALAIVYHAEIRRAIDRAVTQLSRRVADLGPSIDKSSAPESPETVPEWVEEALRAVVDMAATKTGALIVLRGREPLDRHLQGGTALDAIVTEPLLLCIFNPESPGHDGAVVIDDGRAVGFRHHLPLSTDHGQLQRRGTRHAAGLGLAERSDALCIVVSEERGTISVACEGQLRVVDGAEDLHHEVARFLQGRGRGMPSSRPSSRGSRVRAALASVAAATVLWFFLVHEGAVEYRSYTVPVAFTGVEDGHRVVEVDPPQVKVILSGPRRAFYFVRDRSVGLTVPLFDLDAGEHELTLTASDVDRPPNLEFANIFPRQFRVRIEEVERLR